MDQSILLSRKSAFSRAVYRVAEQRFVRNYPCLLLLSKCQGMLYCLNAPNDLVSLELKISELAERGGASRNKQAFASG
jgi:hypothetical protein